MRPRSANGRKSAERAPTINLRFPACRRGPDALALALGQAGMPLGGPRAEASREPIEELRGERDLRQKDKRLALLSQRFGDRLEINLGLARAGHALEQGRREGAVGDEADEVIGRGALIGVEGRQAEIRIERRRAALRRERDGLKRAVGDKAVDDASRARRRARQARLWASARRSPRARPGRAPARPSCASAPCRSRQGRTSGAGGSAISPARIAMRKEHAARRQRPAGGPIDEVAQCGTERRPVEDLGDGFKIAAAGGRADHTTPVAMRAPSGMRTKAPGSSFKPGGRAVAVSGVDGDRGQHVNDFR